MPDPTDSGTPAKATSDGLAKAALDLLEAGLTFLESLASGDAGRHGDGVDVATTQFPFSALFHRDRPTDCTLLSIPVPAFVAKERLDERSPAWYARYKRRADLHGSGGPPQAPTAEK